MLEHFQINFGFGNKFLNVLIGSYSMPSFNVISLLAFPYNQCDVKKGKKKSRQFFLQQHDDAH
jgi:hypothetical protein